MPSNAVLRPKPADANKERENMSLDKAIGECQNCGKLVYDDIQLDICDNCDEKLVVVETDDLESEPDEGDYITSDYLDFYQYGKLAVETSNPPSIWQAAVRQHMDANEYWPNVWFISDHGNAHLLDIYEEEK